VPRPDDIALAVSWQAGDRAAGGELVRRNEGLIHQLARRLRGTGTDLGELLQEGRFGFLVGARRFDPSRGFKVATYCLPWARAYMHRHAFAHGRMCGDIPLPKTNVNRTLMYNARRVARLLYQNGEEPTHEAIAAKLGLTPAQALPALAFIFRGRDGRLDEMDGWGRPTVDMSAIVNPHETASEPRDVLLRARLLAALDTLPARDRSVIERSMAGETIAAIGRDLGVSRERARQLEARALGKLREVLVPGYVRPVDRRAQRRKAG
jgi:RNA polymerase sigma-32 factor